jgi:hypothetical protein
MGVDRCRGTAAGDSSQTIQKGEMTASDHPENVGGRTTIAS